MLWFGCKSSQPSECFVPNVSSACALSLLHISSKIFFLVTVIQFLIFLYSYSLYKSMMYTVFPVPIFTGFLAHCDYHVAALTLACRFVVMPPGDATEGQTTAFPAQKSPVTFPQCSFFSCPPQCFLWLTPVPPSEWCHGHSEQNNSSKSNKTAHNEAQIQPWSNACCINLFNQTVQQDFTRIGQTQPSMLFVDRHCN